MTRGKKLTKTQRQRILWHLKKREENPDDPSQPTHQDIARMVGVHFLTVFRLDEERKKGLKPRRRPIIPSQIETPLLCPGCNQKIDVVPCIKCTADKNEKGLGVDSS